MEERVNQELIRFIADIREQAMAGHAALTCKQYSEPSAIIYGLQCFYKIMKILEKAEKDES